MLLRTQREQLWQSCRIVSFRNTHNFSAQNPKSVKNRWIFHINQLSSKCCSGDVKPNFFKPAEDFPLECRKSFLKRRKRIKTISSSFRKHLYSTCSSGHMGGSFTNLSKSFPQTYRKRSPWSPEKFFRKNQKRHERNNIFQRKIVFLDMNLWKHWASLWERSWKRLAEILKKIRSKMVKILVIILLSQTYSSPKWSSGCERRSFDKEAERVLPESKSFCFWKENEFSIFWFKSFFPQNVPLWR